MTEKTTDEYGTLGLCCDCIEDGRVNSAQSIWNGYGLCVQHVQQRASVQRKAFGG